MLCKQIMISSWSNKKIATFTNKNKIFLIEALIKTKNSAKYAEFYNSM